MHHVSRQHPAEFPLYTSVTPHHREFVGACLYNAGQGKHKIAFQDA